MTSSMIPFRSASVGYAFHPTDEDLINHFLNLKMIGGHDHEVAIISEVNVCNSEPWELPGLSAIQSNDQQWYFFSPRNSNSPRVNRKTEAGFWKVTGKYRIIRAKNSGEHIASKRTFVFYKNRVPNGAVRTNWVMHEYIPTFNFHDQKDFVLCKLKKYPDDTLTFEKGESTSNMASDFPNNAEGYQQEPSLGVVEGDHD